MYATYYDWRNFSERPKTLRNTLTNWTNFKWRADQSGQSNIDSLKMWNVSCPAVHKWGITSNQSMCIRSKIRSISLSFHLGCSCHWIDNSMHQRLYRIIKSSSISFEHFFFAWSERWQGKSDKNKRKKVKTYKTHTQFSSRWKKTCKRN